MSSIYESRERGKWMETEAKDMRGRDFKMGDKFAKACTSGRAVNLEICTITRIDDNGKIYANGSKVPINFPGRCLIVNEIFTEP
jgi:hypothetical protein